MKEDKPKKRGKADAPLSSDPIEEAMPSEYVGEMKAYLKSGKPRSAYNLASEAVAKYPGNPLILSYYGYLQAVADLKYRTGIETCKRAIELAGEQRLFGEEALYAVFYLNLGRVYLGAGMKQDAIDSFRKGIKFNPQNSDLLNELRGLGARKKAPLAFLDRANLINKYLGKILHKRRNKRREGLLNEGIAHGDRDTR